MLPLGRSTISAPECRIQVLAHSCGSSYKASNQCDDVDHHANSGKVPENSQQKIVGHNTVPSLLSSTHQVVWSVKVDGVTTTEEAKTRSMLNIKIIVPILIRSFA